MKFKNRTTEDLNSRLLNINSLLLSQPKVNTNYHEPNVDCQNFLEKKKYLHVSGNSSGAGDLGAILT